MLVVLNEKLFLILSHLKAEGRGSRYLEVLHFHSLCPTTSVWSSCQMEAEGSECKCKCFFFFFLLDEVFFNCVKMDRCHNSEEEISVG